MTKRITQLFIFSLSYFIILFDVDGLQVGLTFWDAPNFAIQVASAFGNLTWILGVLMGILGGIILWMSTNDGVIEKSSQ